MERGKRRAVFAFMLARATLGSAPKSTFVYQLRSGYGLANS